MLQNLFMDGSSHSFHNANPTTHYSATVIGGDLTNTGNIMNGNIDMTSTNDAKAGDFSFSIPDIPGLMNLQRRKDKKLAVLLI